MGWRGGYFHLPTLMSPNANRRVSTHRVGKPIGISLRCKEPQKGNLGSNPPACELILISPLDPGSQDETLSREWRNENNLPNTPCKDVTTVKINPPLHTAEVPDH